MSDLKLGQIIDGVHDRDAIHVAVAPVIAAERLVPGTHVGFVKDGDTERVGARSKHLLGVVDPFLTGFVNIGERFWLFLYPQTITSLRHDWTHPAFDTLSAKAISEKWIRAYADEVGQGYDWLIRSAEMRASGDDGLNSQTDMPNVAFTKAPEFWRHFEVVTGLTVPEGDRDRAPFYCGC